MKALGFVLSVVLLLGVTSGWAQTTTPAPGEAGRAPGAGGQSPAGTSSSPPAAEQPGRGTPPASAPGGTAPDAATPRPGTSGDTAPGTTAPRAQAPGAPDAPGDRTAAESDRILGLSPLAAAILGLVVLGIIVLVLVGRGRRDTDIVVDSRADARLDEPPASYESEIERERRRRAS